MLGYGVYYEAYMKRFFAKKWSAVLLLVFFLSILGGVVSAATKNAEFTLYWSDANKNALKGIFDDGEKQEEIGNKMVIAAKGDLFGNEGVVFAFDSEVNQQLNQISGNDLSDNYYATTKVYCKGDNLTLVAPTSKPYQEIDYTLGFHVNDWNNIENDATYKLYAGITKIRELGGAGTADKVVFAKGSETGTGHFNPTKLGDNGDHGGNGGDAKDHISGDCFDALSRGELGGNKLRNFYKLSEAEKTEVEQIVSGASGGTGGGGAGGGSGGGSTTGTNCAGGAMGWLFCPLINYMAKTIQLTAGLVDNLMTVKFLSNESGGKSIEGIWRGVLSVANIMLLIAFMFIIFSQSSSVGLSNYGIKRMLPRLVIAAILMNLSFYICAIAIDFSNIIGGSVMGFLLGTGNTIQTSVVAATGGSTGFLSSPGNAVGTVVGGIAIIALLFFLLTPLILGILAFFVAIVGRQVILLVLVLVSPLAFVAWLLPNTEKYFKKWSELFLQLLILYPAVMAVFGAALLLSNLIGASGSQGLDLTGG